MAFEPSAEDIDQFSSIVGSTKEVAVKWLRNSNNVVSNAISSYFDRGGVFPPQPEFTWDEGAFHSDKTEYGPQNRPQNSFTVHSQDTLNPAVFDGTISRPPSRVSNRGMTNNAAGQMKPLTAQEQEDEDLQKAMAMSMNHNVDGQEMGVMEPTVTHFGPANNYSHYETSQWAMTATGHHAQEILQNPDPEFRKRHENAPAFIKPSPAGHYLPALITILHEIPVAREALLARDVLLPDYGTGSEWWDGVPIQAPKIIDLEKETEDTTWQEMIFEPQRLMAFLDQTDRAYGSTDVLANLEGIRNRAINDAEGAFLEQWQAAISREAPDFVLEEIFESSAVLGTECKDFHSLSLPLYDETVDCGQTLYDALDNTLWSDPPNEYSEDIYLNKVADVLVIIAHRWKEKDSDAGLGIKIPAVWYADRYLKGSISTAKDMRLRKASLAKEIKRIEEAQSGLTKFKGAGIEIKSLDPEKLLNLATSHFGQKPSQNGVPNGPIDVSVDTGPHKTSSAIIEELEAVAQRIAEKFQALEDSKEKARHQMRELSKLYTQPTNEHFESPHHKYTLRGVSTNPQTTYVLANPKKADDLMDIEAAEWQWWKINYSCGDAHPITYTKLREIEVLKAAKDESQRVLLVYANERAMAYEGKDLPSQLRNFVRTDNLAFAAELEKAKSQKPPTPPKRKAEDDYGDLTSDVQPNWGGFRDETPPLGPVQYPMQPPPPTYTRSKPPPAPPRSSAFRNKSGAASNYDDMVPISLSVEDTTVDPSNISYNSVDLLGDDHDLDQEMEQRGSGMGIVPGGTGVGAGEYALGDYQPEIEMDDVEDEKIEKAKAD